MDVNIRRSLGWLLALLVGLFASVAARAQSSNASGDVTFNKDIVPILQRSCQDCHRPAGAGPMSLITYEEVRPWARAIKERTHLGPHAGVMPPWTASVPQNMAVPVESIPSLPR
jgi:mono/diheme cytochrome c family protein